MIINETLQQFLIYVLVIVLIYLAQTFFKISATRRQGTFDWKELIFGIFDYAIYFVGVLMFFYAGTLIPDMQLIAVGDKSYNITDALTLIAVALIGIQSAKAFKNIRETFAVKDEDIKTNNINSVEIGKNG